MVAMLVGLVCGLVGFAIGRRRAPAATPADVPAPKPVAHSLPTLVAPPQRQRAALGWSDELVSIHKDALDAILTQLDRLKILEARPQMRVVTRQREHRKRV